jgi:hypothetical protein
MVITCKLEKLYVITYSIFDLNEKCDAEILEYFPVVSKFVDVFIEELSGLLPKRELEFTIYIKPGTKPIAKMPYQM